jgi:hypothetical protein
MMRKRLVSLAALLLVTSMARAADPVADLRAFLAQPRAGRADIAAQPFAKAPLTVAEAREVKALLWADHVADIKETRTAEWNGKAIVAADKTLKLLTKNFGTKPKDGWNLFISMHGGGNAPPEVNDQQWENQIKLYQPKDSLYIAPRAPTDTWNLWHESHIDILFEKLIEDAIVLGEVNPNRVYLMGYSAGGDGVYQLAPRMADHFAAASMMAGHPNDASPLGLRDLPFTIHVGALDNGYNRNKIAAEWGQKLDALEREDPKGYVHLVKLHEGRPHWMNLEDRVAVDWMLKYTRNPIPEKVVWKQGNAPHDRFYWLAVPKEQVKPGNLIVASREKQTIRIEKVEGVTSVKVLLSDAMVDLDKPVRIEFDGKAIYEGLAPRTAADLAGTLAGRGDPEMVFPASVSVELPATAGK